MQYPLLNESGFPFRQTPGAGGRRVESAAFRPLSFEENPETESNAFAKYLRIVLRYKGTVLLVSFLGALAAFLVTIPQTPVYQAKTTFEVHSVNENFLNMRDLSPTASSPDYELQTQTRVLESRSLIERVVNRHPDVARKLLASRKKGRLHLWAKVLGLVDAKEQQAAAPAAAIPAVLSALRVHAQPNTRVIDVTVDSTDPQLAADLANAVGTEFIELNLDQRWNSTQHTSDWLTRQIGDLKIKLEKSEEALQAYARSSNLVFTSERDNVAEARLRQLQDELLKAQADRVARQARYELTARGYIDTLPEVQDDSTLRDYQVELTTLRRQLAELSASYTPAHTKFKKVQLQIAAVQNALERKRANIVARLRNEYDAARRREQLLSADCATQLRLISAQSDKVAHYNVLKREVDTTRQLYDSMFQRVKEAGLASALRASNIQIIDPAQAPAGPYKPHLFLNTVLGLVSGVFVGLTVVVMRDRADRRIEAPGDAALHLNVPELGVIPREHGSRNRLRLPGARDAAARLEREGSRLELTTWQRHLSPIAEAFRVTLTSILFSGQGQDGSRPRVLVVSSAAASEGKTTIASNLAIALAQASHRVLLIDGDIRHPRLHDIFNIERNSGFTDVLARKSLLTVRETKVANLFLLPSGSSGDANLLFTPVLGELLGRLRTEFDMVLIDTPPLLQMPDARILGRHADAVILVVRAHATSRAAARMACERLDGDGVPVLGAVLTDWNPGVSNQYGYSAYYSYSQHRSAGS